jgi:hypothetical protein
LGIWAVLCGALTSNSVHWRAEDLLRLALIVLLAEVGWGSLWDLALSGDWLRLLRAGRPGAEPARVPVLPYTLAASPAGRLAAWWARRLGWWRDVFWPAAGADLLGFLAATALAAVLALLLPSRLYVLYALFAGLLLGSLLVRRWLAVSLAGASLVLVGLGWLAGHLAFAPLDRASLGLAAAFSLATWGSLWLAAGHREPGAGSRGSGTGSRAPRLALWLLNGGVAVAMGILVWLKQPLPAAAVGFFLLGQVAAQPALHQGTDPAQIARRGWPWLLAAIAVAALALP